MNNEILKKSIETLDSMLAKNINVIDFKKENPFTDYFVICESSNKRQIQAIVNKFNQLDKEDKLEIRDVDGTKESGWVAIDLYDVVVHIFEKSVRQEYELDKLFYNYPQKMYSSDV